jgi:serine O-acetyltransferase
MTDQPAFKDLVLADIEAHDRHHGTSGRGTSPLRLMPLLIDPYFVPVLLIRVAAALRMRGRLGRLSALVVSRLNYFLFGLEVASQTSIGPGLYMPHTRGTVIGAASIGRNAVIYHGVTLGARTIDVGFNPETRPVIGHDVLIAAGAKVVGPVRVGDGARVGPNAVVIGDVAANTVVVAPAAIVLERDPD